MIEMIDENQNEDIKESRAEKKPKVRKVSKTKNESKVKDEPEVEEEIKAKRESKSKKEVKAKRDSKVKKMEEIEVTPPPKNLKRNKSKSPVELELDQLWFEPDCILGATDRWHGQMAFRFKVKDSDEIEILPAKIAKVLCPQLVINFYQDHLVFFNK